MSAYIHTYTYIHTHTQNVHMNARKHAWNDGAAANVLADEGSFALLFHSTQSNHITSLRICIDLCTHIFIYNIHTYTNKVSKNLVDTLAVQNLVTGF